MSDIGKIYLRGPLVGGRGVTLVSVTINGLDVTAKPGDKEEVHEPVNASTLRTVEVSPVFVRYVECVHPTNRPYENESNLDSRLKRYGTGKTIAEIMVDMSPREGATAAEAVREDAALGVAFRAKK